MTSLSLKDAAQRAGVSEKTLRRKLTATPPDIESTKDERGRYQVTLAALAVAYPHVLEPDVQPSVGAADLPAEPIDPRFGTQLELDNAPDPTAVTSPAEEAELDTTNLVTTDDVDDTEWTDTTDVIELEPFDESLLDLEIEDEDEDEDEGGDVDTRVEGGNETGDANEISPTSTSGPRIIEPERPSGVPSWAPHPDTVLGALRRVKRRRR